MIRLIIRMICTGCLLVCANILYAQSLEQAKKWFAGGKYDEAKQIFEKLVKQAPNNASYNYLYGACAYETGDMITAETYLTISVKRRVVEAYPYLAELYMKEYRFGEAAQTYGEYIETLVKKKENVDPYRKRMELAEKAQRMVDRVENVQIIDSIVLDKNNFLSTYILSDEAGSLSWFKNFFQTSEPVVSTVYMNELGDKIFYAHPNVDGEQYNLYTQSKLADKWGDEKRLPDNINSGNANVNFPFVMLDGLTIYYASDGEGSIGGYDLFVTRYNTNSDAYLAPEQLGMPFNSFANDYMLVVDEAKGLGWFVSDRNQPEGKVCAYLFIPDPQRSRVEGGNQDYKRSRAMITSIADTWKAGVNYAETVKKARSKTVKQQEKKKDFQFVINNNLVYYTLNDIKSPEARNLYEKHVKANEQINSLEKRLETLRLDYSKGNQSKKNELKPSILQAEAQLSDLLGQESDLEKRARNAEINHLLKNNR